MVYKNIIRPLLFTLSQKDPEIAHDWALKALRLIGKSAELADIIGHFLTVSNRALEQEVWGVRFPNPVGVAAGFDKNFVALRGLQALGFGYLEGGSVTRYAQVGKPRPRIHRFPKDQALINFMDFPNHGADEAVEILASTGKLNTPLIISIWKSSKTPIEKAGEDCAYSLGALYTYGDVFVIDISCPNDATFSVLSGEGHIERLLAEVMRKRDSMVPDPSQGKKPILVKLSPDLSREALEKLIQMCLDKGAEGFVAVNTTTSREGLSVDTDKQGGLSGRPLQHKTLAVVRHIYDYTEGKVPIIGVGGIFNHIDAWNMIRAGATLIQINTGFYYEGPFAPAHINRGLLKLMKQGGISNIYELIGQKHP